MLFLNRSVFTLIFISIASISLSAKQEVAQTKVNEVAQEVKKTPFEIYWEKYYPNAKVLCAKFEQMTPEDIDTSIKEITKTFSGEPWTYFLNNKKNFDVRYLESILSEFRILSGFVSQARVHRKKNIVKKFEYGTMTVQDQYNYTTLKEYWEKKGCSSYHELYALEFDFLVIKFNSYILSFFKEQRDVRDVDNLLWTMSWLVGNLVGSAYEAAYQENVKRFKKVFEIWKQQLKEKKKEEESDDDEYDDYD